MNNATRTLRKNSKELKTILSELGNYETINPGVIGGCTDSHWIQRSIEKGGCYVFTVEPNGDLIVLSGNKQYLLRKKEVGEVVEEEDEVNAKKEAIKEMFMEEYGVALRFVDITAEKVRVGMHGLDIGLFRKMRFMDGSIETDKSGGCVIQVNAGNLRIN